MIKQATMDYLTETIHAFQSTSLMYKSWQLAMRVKYVNDGIVPTLTDGFYPDDLQAHQAKVHFEAKLEALQQKMDEAHDALPSANSLDPHEVLHLSTNATLAQVEAAALLRELWVAEYVQLWAEQATEYYITGKFGKLECAVADAALTCFREEASYINRAVIYLRQQYRNENETNDQKKPAKRWWQFWRR
jgi:hypothetical protein